MPAISPRLGEFLIKTTGAKDIDNAFYSVFVEQDFWQWEEAITLKNHYETLQKEWI